MAAPKGNQYTRKWNVEDYKKALEQAREEALKDPDCYTFYKAVSQTGIPLSTIEKACVDFDDVLGSIKKDILNIIADRIASGAIKGDYSPAPSIFMLKNLGYTDRQEIKHTGDDDAPITFKGS